ncbi:MAG TPA: DUF1223 domain-containing protein [Pseudoxanthomonas sp.]|nr:DUF1223 domain-containing protein [Pseudoxanthomonas sp.]
MRLTPICLMLLVSSAPAHAAGVDAACEAASGTTFVPLVELYTAEGCNECPPADRWMERWKGRTDAAALAFHVDYWNDLGWPDRFSSAANTKRQQIRVASAGKQVVYTPQVMVGAKTMLDWRKSSAVDALVERLGQDAASVGLKLTASRADRGVDVRVQAAPVRADTKAVAVDGRLWLALYQDGLVTDRVAAGENKGKRLRHERVVRALHGPWRLGERGISGHAFVEFPANAVGADMGLVLFAETADLGRGLQSLQLPLSSCLP